MTGSAAFSQWARQCYTALLAYPWALLAALLAVSLTAASFGTRLEFDASSETLVVEGDLEFAEYTALGQRFPSDDYLFITVTPPAPLFSAANLDLITELQAALDQLPGVARTTSIANAPLLQADGLTTLAEQPELLSEAASYFGTSSLFDGQLVSEDGNSAAIQAILKPTEDGPAQVIAQIRQLREQFAGRAQIQIAGVPLIAHDMMAYLRSDIRNFGIAAAIVIGLALFLFFRRIRWVGLCAGNAILSTVLVVGLLGGLQTPVSVVSGNFISLLAIISISLTIHLVVRYRELLRVQPRQSHRERVLNTMISKFPPCFYTAATTIVAFISLMASGIPPVEDFGWMMAVGVVCAFVVTYSFFPAVLLLLGPGRPGRTLRRRQRLTMWLGAFAQRHTSAVVLAAVGVFIAAAIGIGQLSLNSHFSQYFRSDSDIRNGLEFVDAQFGGVLPMHVVLRYPIYEPPQVDEDDDFFMAEQTSYPASSWYTSDKVEQLKTVTRYLRARDDVGSATSFADFVELAEVRTGGAGLDDLGIAVLATTLAKSSSEALTPYANPGSGEMRIAVRMREATATADYNRVVNDIEQFSATQLGIEQGRVATSGMFILFGQSIRQLYESQRNTLAYVVVITLVMFIVLLRSVSLGLIAIVVNILAAASILAYMGYARIPLDMMTITIAAITIGIGVDDAFHYLHRYIEERQAGHDPAAAIDNVHASIGRAIYFTSITVIAGFSILSLSNFVPTIYFGALTALAMFIALSANLLLLPSVLLLYETKLRRF